MRKILYISGTRADYGLMRETLLRIRNHPKLRIEIVVTGMHLMSEFGMTIDQIIKDKFKIYKLRASYRKDNKESMANFIGEFVIGFTKLIRTVKPDIILLLGDKAEMLGAAIVGAYLTLPLVHIHGGDISFTVDEVTRHAITKLSNLHLAATKKSAERIIRMGEEPWRVQVVGAPGLDYILKGKRYPKDKIAKKYGLDLSRPVILVIQHPVTAEIDMAQKQMTETLEAVKKLEFQSIVVYPNADPGGRKIIETIKRYQKRPFIKTYKSILYQDYLSLLGSVDVLIGNSSSGIIEAPSFKLPVVNIGTRQRGRERADNIIDVDYDRRDIAAAIKRCIYDQKFKRKIRYCRSPYGDGRAGERIANILSKIKINQKLLYKQLTY